MNRRKLSTEYEQKLQDLARDKKGTLLDFIKVLNESEIDDLNFYSRQGDNLLHDSICTDRVDIALFLIASKDDFKLDIEAANDVDVTPLGYSVQDDATLAVTKELIRLGCRKGTILAWTVGDNNAKTKSFLMKSGVEKC